MRFKWQGIRVELRERLQLDDILYLEISRSEATRRTRRTRRTGASERPRLRGRLIRGKKTPATTSATGAVMTVESMTS